MLMAVALFLAVTAGTSRAADDPPAAQSPAAQAAGNDSDVYDQAKQLFDQYAPPEVKAQYDFPQPGAIRRFPGQGPERHGFGKLSGTGLL